MMQRCFGCMYELEEGVYVCPYCGYAVGTPAEEAVHMQPGSWLAGRYLIGRVLGFGGFGVTYIGWDHLMQRRVAIKEYFPGEFSTRMMGKTEIIVFDGEKSEQFQNGMIKFVEEARHLAQFQNEPGIVRVFDSFEANNTAYIITEYLEGETLAAYLEREGTIPEDQAVAMLMPVMESLKKVHEVGILHRDIAPDNIFLTTDGEVKLIDFGASRYATTTYSRSLTVIIKQGYSPEEQYRSRGDQGPHTDVYALAATLYRMMTGETPPDAMERRGMFESKGKDILTQPHKLNKKISRTREVAILNGLNVRIQDRTPDVQTLINELQAEKPAKLLYGKIKMTDIGGWPLWLKILVPALATAAVVFLALLLTGVINTKRQADLPEGIIIVPSVEGMNNEEAVQLIESKGLLAQTAGTVKSAYVKAGVIVLQSPSPGTYLSENGSVKLTVSSGQEVVSPVAGKAVIPYLVWDSLEEAKEKLEKAGLVLGEVSEANDENVAEGQVISQNLPAGEEVEEGTAVSLIISRGGHSFGVENVVGKTEEEARKALSEQGLMVKREYVKDDNVPEGSVVSQSIEGGSQVKRGDAIIIVVSSGKELQEVPALNGMTAKEAEEALKAAGFTVNILENYDQNIEKGQVISQEPAAKSQQEAGAEITIIISKGKPVITVSFDAAGGKAISEKLTVYEGEAYGELPIPSRSGYSFEGWYLSVDAENPIQADTAVSGSSDHTLIAKWKMNETTAAPTTPAPTTPAPTTPPPTTPVPTTPVPTTPAPTTPAPTTAAPVVLNSIALKSGPSKTTYNVGESLNTAGLVLAARYSNGTSQDVYSGFSCSPTKLDKAGTQAITVNYQGKTTGFNVTVNAVTLSSIAVKSGPGKTTYNVGESLNTAGLVLTARYSNGTSQDVSSGFSCSPTKLDKAGTQAITVNYGGKSTTFNVTVNTVAVNLNSISVKSGPSKTSYFVGESLDPTGLVLTAKYSDGSSKDIKKDYSCSPTSLDTAGTQAITVTYKGKTTTFNVTVNAVTLSSIAVKSGPSKTSYFVGESLDPTGLVLTAKYSNGSSKDIKKDYSCSPASLDTAGTQAITVTYKGKTTTFNVTVNAVKLSSIAVKTAPSKTSYFVGESLDPTGLVLTAKYSNGSSKDIKKDYSCSPTSLDTAGTQAITVSYKGKTTTFNVTVNAVTLSSIAVKSGPSKTSYFVGESLDPTGLVLTAKYSNGSSKDIKKDYSCSPTSLDTAGTQAITVTYKGKTTTFNVTVNAVNLSSIAVKSNPSKTSYFVGESLNTSGLVLTAKYNNGSSKDISSGFTCSPTQFNTAGSQTVKVSYGGKETSFSVNVASVELTSVSVRTNPNKTTYYVGDSLNTSGLTLTAYYNNGSSSIVDSGFSCDPVSFSSAGTRTVTVTYRGKTTSFSVNVNYRTMTVYFNANGGSVSQGSKTVTYNNSYGDLPTPSRSGYIFDGWYTSSGGGSRVTSSTTVTSTSDHSIYAHWTSIWIDVSASASTVYVGGSIKLTASTNGSGTISWSSSNSSVVSLQSSSGSSIWVDGRAAGSATITATVNGVSDRISLNVPTPSISLSSTSGSGDWKWDDWNSGHADYNGQGTAGYTFFWNTSLPTVYTNNMGGVVTENWSVSSSNAKINGSQLVMYQPGTYTCTASVSAGGKQYTATYTFTLKLYKITSDSQKTHLHANLPGGTYPPSSSDSLLLIPTSTKMYFTEIRYTTSGGWLKGTYNGKTGWFIGFLPRE